MRVLPWELRKLLAQWRPRAALAVCAFGPVVATAVLQAQAGLPADALFGRQVHDSGPALSLLLLGFAGTWALPLLTSVLAGDVFSSEDAHGTWGGILTRSRSRAEVFAAKLAAACLSALVLLATAAVSSLLAGLLLVGTGPLVDLSGQPVSTGRACWLVLACWATVVPPLLAFTAVAVLLSVLTRSSLAGIGGPVLLGLLMQVLALVGGLGRSAGLLLTTPFGAWHGLVRADPFYGPLWQGALVSVAWALPCVLLARRALLHRDVA